MLDRSELLGRAISNRLRVIFVVLFWMNLCFYAKAKADEMPKLDRMYGGLTESIHACKRWAKVSAEGNPVVILDIGCAVGDFVRLFNAANQYMPPRLEYIAIGVDPLISLYHNERFLLSHDLYRTVKEAVVGDRDGVENLYVNHSFLDLSSIKSIDKKVIQSLPKNYESIKNSFNEENISIISCPSITLQTLCQEENIERVDILKLDTQGNEFEILNCLSKELFSLIGMIYVETSVPNKKNLYKEQKTFKEVYNLLEQNNFVLFGVYGLDDEITLRNSIDINCLYINKKLYN